MAKEELKEADRTKTQEPREIIFRCLRCEGHKPLAEMRVITRFFPLLVVCQECEKELR